MTKIGIVVCTLMFASTGIGLLFWQQDIQYRLPTPMPTSFDTAVVVSKECVEAALPSFSTKLRLLHFFNPDCPCSKFNVQHIKAMMHRYGKHVTLTIVIPRWADVSKAKSVLGYLADSILIDADQSIASLFGIYSTPQAVLLDNSFQVLYRGNYNTSRYCSNPQTEFVRLSIEKALTGHLTTPMYGGAPYGCPITLCSENNQP